MKKITLLIFLTLTSFTFAQVAFDENFDSGTPAGWTDTYSNTSSASCAGNSERDNLWSSSNTGNLTSPNFVGASNATDLVISFDYKILDYSDSSATSAGWGTAELQYSTDDGTNWTTVFTIDDGNHVVSTDCATVSATVIGSDLPIGSDVKVRVFNTWVTGDYYFYIDNFSAAQTVSNPPSCTTLSAPLNGDTNVSEDANLTWNAATGIPTGYSLSVGTSPGGSDVVSATDVGNVTSYDLPSLSYSQQYFVTIIPYNDNGMAMGCAEESFTVRAIPPAGEVCGNPILINTLPYNESNGTTAGFGDDYSGSPGTTCFGSTSSYLNGDDIVYAYTATADAELNVVLTPASTSDTWSGIFVYTDCSDIGSNACVAGVANSGTSAREFDFVVTNGVTYYFVISTYPTPQSTNYSLDITENSCINPTVDFSVVNDCDNSGGFMIEADITDLGSATSLTVSDDQGSTDQSASSTGVVSFGPYANGTEVTVTITNEQDGTCFVSSDALTQSACPPVNDLPSGAITLTLDEGSMCGVNTITGISNEATTDSAGATVPSCGSYGTPTDRGDLWYVFTAPSATVTLNVTNVSGLTSVAGTYYTGVPGSFVEAGCTEFGSGWPWELTGLSVGQQYYLRVWDYSNDQSGTFDLCGYYLSCTSGEATATTTTNCDTAADSFFVEVTFSAENDAIGINDGIVNYAISEGVATAGPYTFGTSVTIEVVHSNLACNFELGTYQVDVCPPANDNCSDAISLDVNTDETCTDTTSGTTVNATASSQVDDVSGTPNNDVWFSFVATNTSHNISLENITNVGGGTSTSTDMGMGLYELTSDCDNLVFSSSSDPESYTATGLTIGSTYLLRVYGWYSSVQNVTFEVCVQTPPPPPPANDECANAENIPDPTVTVNGTNIGATDSGVGDACVTGNDVWYSFTTDADGGDVSVTINEAGFEYAIYSDCAGTLASACNTGITGAAANTTYYLRIGDDGSPSTRAEGTFSFSLAGSALSVDGFDALDSFKFYPNPVENTLSLNAQQNIELVNVYNMLGQEVMRLAPNSLDAEVDMSPLLTGAYFVKVSVSGATKTVRIIKQ